MTPSGGPYGWLVHCTDAAVPELTRLARTMRSAAALLAHFDTGVFSNGAPQAMNCCFKKKPDGPSYSLELPPRRPALSARAYVS